VGGTGRGFDPAKKVEGSKRHLLVDTEGLVLQAQVLTAPGYQTKTAIRLLLLEPVRARLARLSHLLWVEAGYQGRGRRWAQRRLWG
jgi:putative transposase